MTKAVSVAVKPLNLYVTGHKLGPLIANRSSVIPMGAGLSADDLEFESLLGRYQLTKYADSRNMGIAPGPCRGGL